MDSSKPATGGGEQPAAGGGNSATTEAPPFVQPVVSIGDEESDAPSTGGTGKDVTVNFKCKLTIKGGSTLFGGPKALGGEFGSADNSKGGENVIQDVVMELEGSATFEGGAPLFGGPKAGGSDFGHPVESGKGGAQRQVGSAQEYAAEGGGDSAAV